jgi:hypothetical protein
VTYSPPEGYGPEHPTPMTDQLLRAVGDDDEDLPPVMSFCPEPGRSSLYARVDHVLAAARADVALAEEGRLGRCAYCRSPYPRDETSPTSLYCKRCVERSLSEAEEREAMLGAALKISDSLFLEILRCPMTPDELQVKIRELLRRSV